MSALLELLKKKKQDMAASKRGRAAKIPDGNSRWRFMPSWRGEGQQFWHDFGQHFIKDATDTMQAVYVCVDKTFGKPCDICTAVAHGIKSSVDDATMKALTDARSAGRVLVNGLQLDSSEPHKMEVVEMPPTVFEQLVSICAEWEEDGQTALGIDGKDIIINRSGKGKLTKYTVQVGAKATVIPASVCDKLHDLDAYVQQESSEQALRALNSVRTVAGLLAAPARPSGLPAAAGGAAMLEEDDPYATAAAPVRPTPAGARPTGPVEDAVVVKAPSAAEPAAVEPPWEPEAVAAAPAKAVVAPAAAPVAAAAGTGDADLDALLASLG